VKNVDKPTAAHQTVPPVVTASAPPMGMIGSMVLSTADA
jgi:hypothetical protein